MSVPEVLLLRTASSVLLVARQIPFVSPLGPQCFTQTRNPKASLVLRPRSTRSKCAVSPVFSTPQIFDIFFGLQRIPYVPSIVIISDSPM